MCASHNKDMRHRTAAAARATREDGRRDDGPELAPSRCPYKEVFPYSASLAEVFDFLRAPTPSTLQVYGNSIFLRNTYCLLNDACEVFSASH